MTAANEQRQAQAIESILAAAHELFLELGYARVSMDEVARRARCSKRTLYRHFPSTVQLLTAVLWHDFDEVMQSEDTGATAGDVRSLVVDLIESLSALQPLLADAIAQLPHSPELGAAFGAAQQRWAERIAPVFQRAIARGDIDPEADAELAVLLVNAIATHVSQMQMPVPEDLPDRLTTMLLAALKDPAWSARPTRRF